MLRSTELGAGAAVRRRPVRPNPNEVATARNSVDLPAQFRNPEVVQYISGVNFKQRVASGGQVDFVGRYRARCGIAHLPPPLVTHNHDVGRAYRPVYRAGSEHAEHEQEGDECNWHGCPENL